MLRAPWPRPWALVGGRLGLRVAETSAPGAAAVATHEDPFSCTFRCERGRPVSAGPPKALRFVRHVDCASSGLFSGVGLGARALLPANLT